MSNTIKLNGVGFNPETVVKFPTAEAFYSHASHQHYWQRESEAERHKRLTFVWELAQDAVPGVKVTMNNIQFTNNANTTKPARQPRKSKRASAGAKRPGDNTGQGSTDTEGTAI